MNLTYNRADLLQGNKQRKENEENPVTFAEMGGASNPVTPDSLDKENSRMAGPMGAYAMSLLNDPVAMQQSQTWNERFGKSNQGADFNRTKEQQIAQQKAAMSVINETNAQRQQDPQQQEEDIKRPQQELQQGGIG